MMIPWWLTCRIPDWKEYFQDGIALQESERVRECLLQNGALFEHMQEWLRQPFFVSDFFGIWGVEEHLRQL